MEESNGPFKSAASCMCLYSHGLPLFLWMGSVKLSLLAPLGHSPPLLASHAYVAGLAAGVFLGVNCGETHQLVPADLLHRAQSQVHRLSVDHLQDDILGMVKHQTAIFILLAGQEAVVSDVEGRKPLLAEVVARGTLRSQNKDDVVVGCVHAVEVSKVEIGVGVEERVCLDLKTKATIGRVLRRLSSVELCVAAEEDSLQLAADG